MKAEICPSGLLHIKAENDEEKQQLVQYYCENRTYSGEFYISLSMPEDKYEDGSGDCLTYMSFTACPDDGHVVVSAQKALDHNIKH